MGKYEPLTRYLESKDREAIEATFSQIEDILGFTLPKSAYRYQAWWANQSDGSHTHARGWQDAGWETRQVDLTHRTVRFERRSVLREQRSPFRHDRSRPAEDLVKRAMEISGIENREDVIEAALNAFIQHEAGRQLAAMGGTMPDAQAAPRRRFTW